MTIKATDYEIGLEVIIDTISNFEDGKTTVNGNNLLGFIKRLKNEDITLETSSNNLIIKQGKSIFKLPSYDPNEYPTINRYENLKDLTISTINFINSIKENYQISTKELLKNSIINNVVVWKGSVVIQFVPKHARSKCQ